MYSPWLFRLYVAVGDHDRAISMYKNSLQYDHMIRLVQQHHKELLNETHLHLAQVHLVCVGGAICTVYACTLTT